MGAHSKQKGANFERWVCRQLSRYIDPQGTDTLFWRSAMSGGRATQQFKQGIKNKTQLGDITCVHEQGHWITNRYMLECKFYAKLDIASSLLFGHGHLAKFWSDHVKASEGKDRHPLLIAKENFREPLVLITEQGLRAGLHEVLGTRKIDSIMLATSWMLPEQPRIYLFSDMFPIRKVRK
jgi:hypothetical protein